MRRLLIRLLAVVLALAPVAALADSTVHGLATNTTSPLPASSCIYVDQAGTTDTKLCSGWAAAFGALTGANNLSDLPSPSTARTNLGLGGLATTTPGTGVASTAAAALNSSTGLIGALAPTLNNCIVGNGSAWASAVCPGGGSSAFSSLTGGTNTGAAMLVGTGASLGTTGSGTIAATSAPLSGVTGFGTGVATPLANTANSSTGIIASLAPTLNNCVVGTGTAWSSAACPGGGSVSVTASTPDLVVNPSPGTGTFTVGTTVPRNAQSGLTYTVLTTDNTKTVEMTNASATTVTLLASATAGNGFGFTLICDAGCTVNRSGSDTINGATSLTLAAHQATWLEADGGTAFRGVIGAATDPSNASNLTSGTVASARGGAGTVNGIVKANGSGVTSQAVAGTDYQAPITLTTTGTSGAATFSGGTLNIPNYATGGAAPMPVYMSSAGTTISTSVTNYFSNVSGGATETSSNPVIVQKAGTLKNCQFRLSAALTSGSELFTVRTNQTADTTIAVTLDSTHQYLQDTTHTATVAVGDTLTVRGDPGSPNPNSAKLVAVSCEID